MPVMKFLFLSIITFFSFAAKAQELDLSTAEADAKENNRNILLVFSGSDWCIPCIKMEKQIFEKESFTDYAKQHLVIMHADFPRLKKHQLPKEQEKRNLKLAEKYNKQGSFPYTVLLDAQGKVLKAWDGLIASSPEDFVKQIQTITSANN